MKFRLKVIVLSFLVFLSLNAVCSENLFQPAYAESHEALNVQLVNIAGGKISLINNFTHSSSYAAELIIPSTAPEGSGSMVLYPYNRPLSSLQSFQIYAAYTNATPRFVVLLDINADGVSDIILLSDYQFLSNGIWEITQGGQRWGWTASNPDLSAYGKTWDSLYYWKSVYSNATVLSVGIALEYWAVKGSNGLDQALFADELILLNAETFNIATPTTPSSNEIVENDWSMFRHNEQRSGHSVSRVTNGNLLWRFFTGPSPVPSLPDRLRASPTIVNGVVYIGSNNSNFHALNATTGSPIWQINVGANVESSAAVVDGVVYVGVLWNGYNGHVLALDATTGSEIWRFATNSGIESSPAIVDGVVYVGSFQGHVYALNASSGALIWSYLTGGSTFSSPSVVNDSLYIGSGDGKVYALNTNTGALIWSFQTGSPVYASPAVVDNVVYLIADNGAIYALRANNGSKIWQANIGMGDHSDTSPAVAYGIVYFSARNGFYAFNASTGSQIWFFTSPYSPRQLTGYMYSCPAVAGNVVYVGSPDSYVFALNAFDGSIVWSYRTGGFLFSSPAIANGVLYIGSYDGYVYALGTSDSTLPIPQPTANPTIQPTQTPTNNANATSTPAPTPQSTQNPTLTPTPIPTPSQAPLQDLATLAMEELKSIDSVPSLSIDWIVLGVIIVISMASLAGLLLTFKKVV